MGLNLNGERRPEPNQNAQVSFTQFIHSSLKRVRGWLSSSEYLEFMYYKYIFQNIEI